MQSSSSRILTLIKQAKQTFSILLSNNDSNYDKNDQIDSLKRLTNIITKYDLNFTLFDNIKNTQSLNSIDQKNLEKFLNSNAPVFYMKLYEDKIISVGIFIIKSHHRIPLHDHPHMFGLIKVLDGHGHLNAYNVLFEKNSDELICTKHVSTTINSQSETAVLYPNQSNIHEIYAINNDHCAFLDILSPPYSNENDCTCYIAIPSSTQSTTDLNENDRNYTLKRIFDDEYYTESLQYTGPTISL
jgi:cysteamine dioxygenase